jgi:hypothetical protein
MRSIEWNIFRVFVTRICAREFTKDPANRYALANVRDQIPRDVFQRRLARDFSRRCR